MKKQNFKPCPFCGNSDREWMRLLITEDSEHSVRCCKCNADGPLQCKKTLAILAWNQRSEPIKASASEEGEGLS